MNKPNDDLNRDLVGLDNVEVRMSPEHPYASQKYDECNLMQSSTVSNASQTHTARDDK